MNDREQKRRKRPLDGGRCTGGMMPIDKCKRICPALKTCYIFT
jgi:hypothetical protein